MAGGGEPDEAADAWERHVDDASGAAYFYNRTTGESSWEEPEGFVAAAEGEQQASTRRPPRWRRFTDDASGKAYFYDDANDVTQWDEPEGFAPSDGPNSADGGGSDSGEDNEEERDGDAVERNVGDVGAETGEAGGESETERDGGAKAPIGEDSRRDGEAEPDEEHATAASTDATALARSSDKGEASPAWIKYVDAVTGKPYFYNSATRVTQWEAPSEYQDAASVGTGTGTAAAAAGSAEYRAHLVRVQTERLSRVTQQALDPTGSLSKLNAILSGIGGSGGAERADGSGDEAREGSGSATPEWQQHVDPQTQRYYYYNVVTGVTQWQKPDAAVASGLADWVPPEIPEEGGADRRTVSGVNYAARAKFNRLTGKYEQLGGEDYWQSVGAPSDRAGRQMSHFFDMSALEQNREEARRKAEALKRKHVDWKKIAAEKKAKKLKQKNEWIYTD